MSTTALPFPTTSVAAPVVFSASGRFVFLDGLRGLAALGVCCYHIERYAPYQESVAAVTPDSLTWVVRHSWCGVQVFFVISGFVIAYCLRNAVVNRQYLGEFLTRRTIRLTPPYFAMVLAGLLVALLPPLVGLPSGCDNPVTVGQVVSHLFYLHKIFGYESLSAGFWTLCIEMQFYALFAVLVGISQWIACRSGTRETMPAWSLLLVFMPTGLASLFWWSLDTTFDSWVIHFWCLFVCGALAWWVADRKLPAWWLGAYLGAMALRLTFAWTNELFAATLAGTMVLAASQLGGMSTWLSAPWLQHLGRISYSLYLVHFPISHIVLNLGHRWTGDATVPGIFWMLLSVALSLILAEAFFRLVESPCVKWSARYKGVSAPRPVMAASPQPA